MEEAIFSNLIRKMIIFFEDDLNRLVVFLTLKSIFLLLSLALSVGIIILLVKVRKFAFHLDSLKKESLPSIKDLQGNINKSAVLKRWQEVLKKFKLNTKEGFVLAVIEADSLVDFILKEIGITGFDMGERLKSIKKEQLPCLDELWEVHKLRNRMAHEHGFSISKEETNDALKVYQKMLKELGAI
ncbi:hypothetical protein HY061_02610 [Candidatus Azambacteria bacterium]|nr:hypothetical protein [Candidatus Azambacteria bacterium]